MQRQHDVLRDDLALRIHQRAGGILRFAHDGGEAGAEQRVLHLLHDAGEARLHHFEIDGVDVHRFLSLVLDEPRHCERSEAIHSCAPQGLDCFVASLLAMTLHFSPVTIKFFHSSTRAVCPGQITVVQSN